MAGAWAIALLLTTDAVTPREPAPPSRAAAPIALDFRLIAPEAAQPRPFRITPEVSSDDLLPGDRPTAELCADTHERPREPGAPMRARMSMRLDTGRDAFSPAFALGGIGGALVRMTDALID
ncbi:hypothetical protein [Sphingomonas sp. Y38-1Y]|uniref:hypothetical protein n=1 Tax=Sphingomonas sp. Y38-1Y TaxID=3078265 RepID=UPI0028EFC4A5|nr:hypothetical protein [Sphingomonas sp. Y38-1Y]